MPIQPYNNCTTLAQSTIELRITWNYYSIFVLDLVLVYVYVYMPYAYVQLANLQQLNGVWLIASR